MKQKIISYISNFKEFENQKLENLLKISKFENQGDYTIPIFFIKKNQNKLLENLQKKIPNFLEKIILEKNFLNFFLNKNIFCKKIINEIINKNFFKIKIKNSQKILIEYPSPNTNKSLHIGHMRNIFLGNSISNLISFVGNKTIRTNLYNDRGIAICKTILMYKKYGKNKTPKTENMKSDLFVQKFYEMFEKKKTEELENEALKYLELWEKKDKEIIKIWKQILKWIYLGYDETFKKLKLEKFDKNYYESEIYDKGKKIILNAYKNKCLGFEKENDGAIFVNFDNESIGKKYLLRGNETTLYMTQDIYLSKLKEKDFNCNKNIFIVGTEQEYHFKVLFDILNRINKTQDNKNYHFSYGIIYDKNGNKFSSRFGNVISIDELFEIVEKSCLKELKNRDFSKNLEKKELIKRAEKISYSTLVFSMLKYNPKDKINLDIEKSLSLKGDTASYILYTYARINSVIKKYNKNIKNENLNNFNFSNREFLLIKKLNNFEEVILKSYKNYSINLICNYLIEICRNFNEFYNNEKILNVEDTEKKIFIIISINKIIEKCCEILKMDLLEEM